jgi:hypothetical protein
MTFAPAAIKYDDRHSIDDTSKVALHFALA